MKSTHTVVFQGSDSRRSRLTQIIINVYLPSWYYWPKFEALAPIFPVRGQYHLLAAQQSGVFDNYVIHHYQLPVQISSEICRTSLVAV